MNEVSTQRTTRRLAHALGVAALIAAQPAWLGAMQQIPVPLPPDPDDPTPYSEIQLVSDVSTIQPGTPFTLGVHILMEPGWHTYWYNGGDAGDELLVDWTLPDGFTVSEFEWPTPHLLPVPPLMSYGYEDQVLFLAEVTPPVTLSTGEELEILGAADYQICADQCHIALADISITLPVEAGPPASNDDWAGAIADTRSRLPAPADGWAFRAWTNGSDSTDAAFILEVTPTAGSALPAPAALEAPHFFAGEDLVIEHAWAQKVTRIGESIRIEIPRNYFAVEYAPRLTGVLVADVESSASRAWTFETEVGEVPPDVTAEEEAGEGTGGAAGDGGGGTALPVQETGGVPEGMAPLGRPDPPTIPLGNAGAADVSLLLALLFAFVGGVILNLMPCVFPVLSMKVLGFVEQGGDDPVRARRHGLVFGAGVVVCFWVLAGALMALRASGESLGWGFHLQSPVIIGLLALLLFGLGLNLSGLFEVGVGLTRLGAVGTGGSYRDSFLMGGLTVLVATPCTAPFMGAALGFALVQPALVGLSVFTALAIGLAAPYVILSSAPALVRRLPRPGAWMETFKQAMAFPMYATVVWLVWVFGNQAGMDSTALLLFGLTLLALAAWLYGRIGGHAPSKSVRAAALAIALGGTAVVIQGARIGEAPESGARASAGWEEYSPDRIAALRAEGRPIFLDFTADWCISCKVNERLFLNSATVQDAFAAANVALVKADWTNKSAEIASIIESFGRASIPLYVMYPANAEGEPEVLPVTITTATILEAIDRAVGRGN